MTTIKYIALDRENMSTAQLTAICELVDACEKHYFSLPLDVQNRLDEALDEIKAPNIKEPTLEYIKLRERLSGSTTIDNGD